MKKRYRILTEEMERPTFEYDSGKGPGCTREGNYFTDHDTFENAEYDIQPENTDYWNKNYLDLIIISVYIKD